MATGDVLVVLAGAGARHPEDTQRLTSDRPGITPSDAVLPGTRGLPFAITSGAPPIGLEVVAVCAKTYGPPPPYVSFNLHLRVSGDGTYLRVWSSDPTFSFSGNTYIHALATPGVRYVRGHLYAWANTVATPTVYEWVGVEVTFRLDPSAFSPTTANTDLIVTLTASSSALAYDRLTLTRALTPRVMQTYRGSTNLLDSVFPRGGVTLVTAYAYPLPSGITTVGASRPQVTTDKTFTLSAEIGGTTYTTTVDGTTPWVGYVYVGPSDRVAGGAIFHVDTALALSVYVEEDYYQVALGATAQLTDVGSTYAFPIAATGAPYTSASFNLFLFNTTSSVQNVLVPMLQPFSPASLGANNVTLEVIRDGTTGLVAVPANGYTLMTINASMGASPPSVGATTTGKIGVI